MCAGEGYKKALYTMHTICHLPSSLYFFCFLGNFTCPFYKMPLGSIKCHFLAVWGTTKLLQISHELKMGYRLNSEEKFALKYHHCLSSFLRSSCLLIYIPHPSALLISFRWISITAITAQYSSRALWIHSSLFRSAFYCLFPPQLVCISFPVLSWKRAPR